MSKKVFLIAVLIISLLLIGLMLLVADVRMNTILDDFSKTEEEFKQSNTAVEQQRKRTETSIENYPATIQQFNEKANELLAYIEVLKKDFEVGDSFEEMEAKKNEIFFDSTTNLYTEKGALFIAKIEAYENILTAVYKEFPETKTIASPLRAIKRGEDWLVENYKDFPVISVHASLSVMENTIITKRKDIFMIVLTNP